MTVAMAIIVEKPDQGSVGFTRLPPQGPLSISAFLNKKGLYSQVFDRNIDLTEIDFSKFDMVGFSVNVANIHTTIQRIREIKDRYPQIRIVAGGPYCTSSPGVLLRNSPLDLEVIGEGEMVTYQVLTSDRIETVKGVCYRTADGQIIYTGEQELIKDLDSLPFPALDQVNLRKYYRPVSKKRPICTIFTSRGCPSRCTFCFQSMGPVWRARSPKHVVDEIEWQHRTLGVQELCIDDDNFTLDRQRVFEVFQELKRRNIHLPIQIRSGVRVDKVDYELLKLCRESGVWLISVSPESYSVQTLQRIRKGFDKDRITQVVQWCKQLNFVVVSCFMVGFPWETAREIQQTLDYALQLDTDLIQITRVQAYPKTQLYEEICAQGLQIDERAASSGILYGDVNFTTLVSSSEINRGIQSTYRAFYRKPGKLLMLAKMIGVKNLFSMGYYGLTTRNIV